METETLYTASLNDGTELGIGTREELIGLCDEGILPPREQVTFNLVGTFEQAA